MDIPCKNPKQVASKMVYLAYQASRVLGMGAFQMRSNVTEEQVFNNAYNQLDYPANFSPKNEVRADYVFGRCMKLTIVMDKDKIYIPDSATRPDYQTWSHKYPTYKDLYDAAMKELS